MDLHTIIAASGNGSANFIVGVLLGSCLGYLTGPAIRSWQSYKEWADASREVRLVDRLLDRMDAEADLDEPDVFTDAEEKASRATWRTLP